MAESGKPEVGHDGHQQQQMDAAGGVSSHQNFVFPELQRWFSPLPAVASSTDQVLVQMMAIVQQQNQLAVQIQHQQYEAQQLDLTQQQMAVQISLLLKQQHDFFKVDSSSGVEKAQRDGGKVVDCAADASSCDDTVIEELGGKRKIDFERHLGTTYDDEKIVFPSTWMKTARDCVTGDQTKSGMESFQVERGRKEENVELLEFKEWRSTQVEIGEGSRQLAVDNSCESLKSHEPGMEIKFSSTSVARRKSIEDDFCSTTSGSTHQNLFLLYIFKEHKMRTKQRKLFRSHRYRLRPRTRWKVCSFRAVNRQLHCQDFIERCRTSLEGSPHYSSII
uniref:(northern house mosquito) hypothetical protein n=1 Tax=Culex pipiens TaxID=7175 RepID=A0A8D8J366_CULPI